MQGSVSYLEIGAQDAQVSQDFFRQLFGWPFTASGEQPQEGWFQTPDIRVGLHGNDPAPPLLVFFQVPDMAAAMARVTALGGQADGAGPDEPGFGVFCLCTDPQGARFGRHQPSSH